MKPTECMRALMLITTLVGSAMDVRGQGARVITPEQERSMRGRELSHPPPPGWGTKSLPPTREMTKEHKQRLYPSSEERESFAAFLSQPRTGLVRLLALGECRENPRVVKVGEPCSDLVPPVPGGGAFYSFTSGKYQWGPLAELWIKGDLFEAGFAGGVLGILTTLGDVPLGSATLESDGIDYLSKFVSPSSLAEVEKQYVLNRAGFKKTGYRYAMTSPVQTDTTYALRSITYDESKDLNGMRKPVDVLVVFRVVGKSAEGDVTLLWKELRRQKPAELKP